MNMYEKLMEKLDTCDEETIKRLEIINKKEIFSPEENPLITYDQRKKVHDELKNYQYSLYAKVYIA